VTGSVAEGLRMVTHYGIEEADVRRAADIWESVLEELSARQAVPVRA
jgi:hypothetical protein